MLVILEASLLPRIEGRLCFVFGRLRAVLWLVVLRQCQEAGFGFEILAQLHRIQRQVRNRIILVVRLKVRRAFEKVLHRCISLLHEASALRVVLFLLLDFERIYFLFLDLINRWRQSVLRSVVT